MTDNIKSLAAARAEKENDNRLISPKDQLKEALHDIETGEIAPTKLMIVYVDDTDGSYTTGYYLSNAKATEAIAMCEATKISLFASMGYLDD